MWFEVLATLVIVLALSAVVLTLALFHSEKRSRQISRSWLTERQEHHSARLEIIDLKLRLLTAVRMNEATKLRDGQAGPRVSGHTPQG